MAESLKIEFVSPSGSAASGSGDTGPAPTLGSDEFRQVSASISDAAEAIRDAVSTGRTGLTPPGTPPPIEAPPRVQPDGQRPEPLTSQSSAERFRQLVADSRAGRAIRSGTDRVGQFFSPPPGSGAAARGAAGRATGAASQAGARGAWAGGAAFATTGGRLALTAGAAAVAVGALALGAKKATDVFTGIADDIEDISGPVASVRAQAEARLERARVERAQLLGERVARVEQSRADLNLAIDDLKTSVMDTFADLAPMIEGILDAVRTGVTGITVLKEGIDVLVSLGSPDEAEQLAKAYDKFTQALSDLGEGNDLKASPVDPAIADFLGFNTPGIRPIFPGGKPPRRAKPNPTVTP